MRYFLNFSYKGTNYHGWQEQPGDVTVQSVLTEKLSLVLRSQVSLVGAGRTDAGVHARCMFAHFDVENPIADTRNIVLRLNSLLPPDIAVADVFAVPDDMHARFSAKSRTYRYYITQHKSPFLTDIATRYTFHLDVDKMNEAAALLLRYTDFTSFSKVHTDVKTNDCTVYFAQWEWKDELLVFTIRANRFLRNMVRAVVGTLVEVGKGKMTLDEFRIVIERKNRCAAGMSVPAQGLFLEEIEY